MCPSIYFYKDLLEHNHTHSFTYYLLLHLTYSGEAEELWQRSCGPQKPDIYYLAFYSKSLPILALDGFVFFKLRTLDSAKNAFVCHIWGSSFIIQNREYIFS